MLDRPPIRPLKSDDEAQLGAFDCGDHAMNSWLKDRALREQGQRMNVTYLIDFDAAGTCPGFISMGAAQVARDSAGLDRSQLPYPVAPALFIGRVGVDVTYQGQRLGHALVRFARLLGWGLPIGCRFVALEVERTNAGAMALYLSEGFWEPPGYEDEPRPLMLYDLATTRPA
jgi:GNAT superfamily N-acetyltransferase